MTAKMLGRARRFPWSVCPCRHCRWPGKNKREKRVHQKHPQRRWEQRQWRDEAAREAQS